MRLSASNPRPSPPSTRRFAAQNPRVSKSSKKSAASGRNPARRAALAKARPEDAAIRIAAPASGDLTRETEGIAKIETDRLGGRRHPLKQSRFRLVFHVANRERSNPKTAARQLGAIRHEFKPLDSCGWHRVDIGGNEQGFRRRQHRSRQNLHARGRTAKRDFLARE